MTCARQARSDSTLNDRGVLSPKLQPQTLDSHLSLFSPPYPIPVVPSFSSQACRRLYFHAPYCVASRATFKPLKSTRERKCSRKTRRSQRHPTHSLQTHPLRLPLRQATMPLPLPLMRPPVVLRRPFSTAPCAACLLPRRARAAWPRTIVRGSAKPSTGLSTRPSARRLPSS